MKKRWVIALLVVVVGYVVCAYTFNKPMETLPLNPDAGVVAVTIEGTPTREFVDSLGIRSVTFFADPDPELRNYIEQKGHQVLPPNQSSSSLVGHLLFKQMYGATIVPEAQDEKPVDADQLASQIFTQAKSNSIVRLKLSGSEVEPALTKALGTAFFHLGNAGARFLTLHDCEQLAQTPWGKPK
ncbi:hypothetical protein JJB07_17340 [Tumebacillus sp. ITR2]|uniref:Uncharacterized protein n=1 Tax=Tumebacillus amylolyticus TaxID=2801339 RepID=A0ABS1JDK6_9BACL|nr:hypothetical protein [Tumebacillus amylolyticus]MBL0388372.1 hypothetical protein [Tumebacillus amylolyticus]